MKKERFKKIYAQGAFAILEIWEDQETGVNYLYRTDGTGGGLTVLLDRDGKPVISPIVQE